MKNIVLPENENCKKFHRGSIIVNRNLSVIKIQRKLKKEPHHLILLLEYDINIEINCTNY